MKIFLKTTLNTITDLPESVRNSDTYFVVENFFWLNPRTMQLESSSTNHIAQLKLLKPSQTYFEIDVPLVLWFNTERIVGWVDFWKACETFFVKHELAGFVLKFSNDFVLTQKFAQNLGYLQLTPLMKKIIFSVNGSMLRSEHLARLASHGEYLILTGHGLWEGRVTPLLQGNLRTIVPGSDTCMKRMLEVLDDLLQVPGLGKEQILVNFCTFGTKYVLHEGHVLRILNFERSELLAAWKTDKFDNTQLDLNQGQFTAINKPDKFYSFDIPELIERKLRFFCGDLALAGVFIENFSYDLHPSNPEAIYHQARVFADQLQQHPLAVSTTPPVHDQFPSAVPEQPTSTANTGDETSIPKARGNTSPGTHGEIFEME